MINIKRLFFISLFFSCFLCVNSIEAQRYNQFDKNKKRTGVWKKYYPNKRIKYIGTFKNGKEVGTFKFYNMSFSRNPEAIKVFHKNSDSVTVTYFYDRGKLKGKGMLYGRKKVGKWIYYYKKGPVFSEESYVDGKLSGKSIVYFKSNGKIAEESTYKNGVLNGHSKNFSDKGVLIEDVLYKNGKANGLAKYFELSGSLKEKGIYKDGIRVGKWEFYLDGEVVDQKQKKESRKNKIQQKNK
jgi:antitoxin component YwqK of YwqJK toxin-antitoxin module